MFPLHHEVMPHTFKFQLMLKIMCVWSTGQTLCVHCGKSKDYTLGVRPQSWSASNMDSPIKVDFFRGVGTYVRRTIYSSSSIPWWCKPTLLVFFNVQILTWLGARVISLLGTYYFLCILIWYSFIFQKNIMYTQCFRIHFRAVW